MWQAAIEFNLGAAKL